MSLTNNRIQRGHILPSQTSIGQVQKNPGLNFQDVLDTTIKDGKEAVKISNHARQRLVERNISLNSRDISRLGEAMGDLEKKGAKESLMIYKDLALIASIRSRTIITAMGTDDVDIVTNIDSTMIVK